MALFNFFRSGDSRELFFNTDIHSHLCPGIDDGSPSAGVSERLMRELHGMGIRRSILTPHVVEDDFPNTEESIDRAFETIKASGETIGIQLAVSAEYRIDNGLMAALGNGGPRVFPDGRHILVENAWIFEAPQLEQSLDEIERRGWIPIMAHPERYRYYWGSMKPYRRLADRGVLFQINLLSLSGDYGTQCRHQAEKLLSEGMVSFVGSDLHNETQTARIKDYLSSRDYRKLLDHKSEILNDSLLFSPR